MCCASSDVVRFDLGPVLEGQTRIVLKVLITCLLLVLEVWDGKPTCRKSWAGNLLMWSDLTWGTSFRVKNKSVYNSRIIGPRGPKPTHKKTWAGNLLMLLDLTFGPTFRSNNGSLALVSCLSGG